jgi:hypothetical protein
MRIISKKKINCLQQYKSIYTKSSIATKNCFLKMWTYFCIVFASINRIEVSYNIILKKYIFSRKKCFGKK